MLKYFIKLVLLIFAVAAGRLAYEKIIDLPEFALDGIDLRGNCDMSEDSVMTLCGLKPGESVYRQNLKFALSRLSDQPTIVDCSIKRGLNFDIDVEINTAEPALLIRGDGLYCLSVEGIVLPFESDIPILPLVSGRKFSGVKLYDRLLDADIAYALELYQTMMMVSPDLCSRLSEMNFYSDSQIRVYLSPRGTIAVLNKRDFKDAISRLAVLNDSGVLKGKKIFDLRFGAVAIESTIKKGVL